MTTPMPSRANISTRRAKIHLRNAGLIAAGLLGAAGMGLGPASAAPTGPSAVDTINNLRADGYNVVVNRVGAAPLSDCSVRGVRAGQTHQTVDTRGGSSLQTTVISDTVYVDLSC